MFNLLQKVGKALMTPIAVLPIAAILLRLGFGDIPYIHGDIANIMKVAGETVFSNLDMLFAVGIAYGLAKNNDGAAALSGLVGILIAKAVYLEIDKELNMGVFIGIIIGVLAGTLYNRFHTIKLPEFLGFFGGKRFVPIVTALSAIVIGLLKSRFVFSKIIKKNIERIKNLSPHKEKICIFAFQAMQSYFIILVMVPGDLFADVINPA